MASIWHSSREVMLHSSFKKMYVMLKLEELVMKCNVPASPTRCVKQIQSPFLIAEKQH